MVALPAEITDVPANFRDIQYFSSGSGRPLRNKYRLIEKFFKVQVLMRSHSANFHTLHGNWFDMFRIDWHRPVYAGIYFLDVLFNPVPNDQLRFLIAAAHIHQYDHSGYRFQRYRMILKSGRRWLKVVCNELIFNAIAFR
jgi:hypothetical protein